MRRSGVRIRAPAQEYVIRAGERILRQRLLFVVHKGLVVHRAGSILCVLIELHGVGDGLPDSVQIVDGILLIGGDLGGRCAGRGGVLAAIPNEEVSGGAALGLSPALEGVARAGLGAENVYSLVDLQRRIGILVQAVLTHDRASAIIHVPNDVGGGSLLHILIFGTELDGVVVLAGFNHSPRSHNRAGIRIGDLRIALQRGEGSTGQDGGRRVHIGAVVPGLEHPVIEDLALGGRGGRTGGNGGVVLIEGGVGGGVGAAIGIIENANAIGTDEDRAPLGVEVEFLCDPETVKVTVRRGAVAPLVHAFRHMRVLVVRRRDGGLIQNGSCRKCFRARCIRVPAIELIACTGTGGRGDLAAVVYTEVHLLVFGAPIQRGIRVGIGMEEDTVLDLTPPGIDGDTALGHGGEGIGLCAGVVNIPALEDIAFRSGGRIIAGAILVVCSQIRAIGDAVDLVQLAHAGFAGDPVAVAVIVGTVHEVDGIEVAGVIQADRKVAVKISMPFTVIRRV